MKNRIALFLVCASGAALGTGICWGVDHYLNDATALLVSIGILLLMGLVGLFMGQPPAGTRSSQEPWWLDAQQREQRKKEDKND